MAQKKNDWGLLEKTFDIKCEDAEAALKHKIWYFLYLSVLLYNFGRYEMSTQVLWILGSNFYSSPQVKCVDYSVFQAYSVVFFIFLLYLFLCFLHCI